MRGIEWFRDGDTPLALVMRAEVHPEGARFFTPDDAALQVGLLGHRSGVVAAPHTHHRIQRVIADTCEVLHVRAGRVSVDLYDLQRRLAHTVELAAGDTILLMAGGHGLQVLEDSLVLEVRQGPYLGVNDKERFDP
jgi:hypothetical protein